MKVELEEGELESDNEIDAPIGKAGSSSETDENTIDKIISETKQHEPTDELTLLRQSLLSNLKNKSKNENKEDDSKSRLRGRGRKRMRMHPSPRREQKVESYAYTTSVVSSQGIHMGNPFVPYSSLYDPILAPPPPPPPPEGETGAVLHLPSPPAPPTLTPPQDPSPLPNKGNTMNSNEDNYEQIDMDIEENDKNDGGNESDDSMELMRQQLLEQTRRKQTKISLLSNSSKQHPMSQDGTTRGSQLIISRSTAPIDDMIAKEKELEHRIGKAHNRYNANVHRVEKTIKDRRRLIERLKRLKKDTDDYNREIEDALLVKNTLEHELADLRRRRISESLRALSSDERELARDPQNEIDEITDSEVPENEEMIDESLDEIKKRVLATIGSRSTSLKPESSDPHRPATPTEVGRKLLAQMCCNDLNGICEQRSTCQLIHLDDTSMTFNETLILSSILRHFCAYSEEDIGLMSARRRKAFSL